MNIFENRIAAHQVKVASFGISDNSEKAASLISVMKKLGLALGNETVVVTEGK